MPSASPLMQRPGQRTISMSLIEFWFRQVARGMQLALFQKLNICASAVDVSGSFPVINRSWILNAGLIIEFYATGQHCFIFVYFFCDHCVFPVAPSLRGYPRWSQLSNLFSLYSGEVNQKFSQKRLLELVLNAESVRRFRPIILPDCPGD